MLKSRLLRWPVVLVALVVGGTIVAVASSVGPFSGRPHVSPPPEHVRQAIPLSQVNPATATDQANGIYQGPLGEFLVTPRHIADWPPCPAPYKRTNAKTSELYSPAFGENIEANECADGTIIGLTFEIGSSIGRRYFVGPAKVPYEAPFDRLVLLTVGGHSAIAELPTPGVPGSLRLTVLERFPAGKQPGMLVWVEGGESLEASAAKAAKIMGVRP
jgi:hypothetical protein